MAVKTSRFDSTKWKLNSIIYFAKVFPKLLNRMQSSHKHIPTQTHIHTHAYTHTHTHIPTPTHTHTHIHTNKYPHKHTQLTHTQKVEILSVKPFMMNRSLHSCWSPQNINIILSWRGSTAMCPLNSIIQETRHVNIKGADLKSGNI